MNTQSLPLRTWLFGMAAFAVVIALGVWLRASSEFGIVDHQLAGSASEVRTIQDAWAADGVRWLALLAMAGDLVFIGIYGWGSWIVGRAMMARNVLLMRILGAVVALAAILFLVTDYIETGLQFIQLVRDQGSDWMARSAASMQGIKVASWIATFAGVILGWLLHYISRRRA